MFISYKNRGFAFFVESFFILTIFSFILFLGNALSATASVFQFAEDDPNYLLALSIAAAQEAENEVDVAAKIVLDEEFAPEDFGISGVGLLPTNPFYIFKSIRRGITSGFTFDDVAQAELRFQFASEKLLEAKELASREGVSEDAVVDALENYKEELSRVQAEVKKAAAEADDEHSRELARTMMDLLTKYQKSLGAFEKDLSPEVFERVQEVKDVTAETFTGVFELAKPEEVGEELVKILDGQKGSEFKDFKNIEALKEISEKTGTIGRGALISAQEDALNKLQAKIEQGDATQKALFGEFVKEIGGNEARHVEIINELEARPVSEEARRAIVSGKEGALSKTEDRLGTLSPEQRGTYLRHLRDGELSDIRTVKELEKNISTGVLAGVEKVREQANEGFKKKIEEVGDDEAKKKEFFDSIERFHDARSISVLDEIGALIPPDKKEFFDSLKQKAAQEIKKDIDNARNASQRIIIYQALAGDHPEDVAAIQNLGREQAAGSSVRGILDALRQVQYEQVQNKALTIEDKDRLSKYEEDYKKFQSYFIAAPPGVRLDDVFQERRFVFEDPTRAERAIADARGLLLRLRTLIDTLPLDLGFKEGTFDSVIQQIERTHALAEKKIGIAETSLEYGDVGRAYGEGNAAREIAENGVKTAEAYKTGKKQAQKVPDFLPPNFFEEQKYDRVQDRTTAFRVDIYNNYEFGQFCAFAKGFLKGEFICGFPDGRVLDASGKSLPFRVPQEFVPQRVSSQKDDVRECPFVYALSADFCKGGKIVNDVDSRGCQLTPRCEYAEGEKKDTTDGAQRYHPTDKTVCGGPEGYQCAVGSYCETPKGVIYGTAPYGKCVPDKTVTCQAQWSGYVYRSGGAAGDGICVFESITGCSDPFVYKTKEQCDTGQRVGAVAQCSDGKDNDLDGKIDYPADTGCYGASDPDETLGTTIGVCPATPTVTSCPAGQKLAQSFSSPECGTYYSCVADDTGTTQNWIQHTWRFTDGETTSMILPRTDSEYLTFIKGVENQCLKIPKAKFAWKVGAGNDSASNWQNFGIPDCSGIAVVYQCGNNVCDPGETTALCSQDCGGIASTPHCSDGKDNDGDGQTDYPADTGCYGKDDWDEASAATASTMQRCFYPNATKDAKPIGYTVWCEKDYYNCHEGSPTGAVVSLTGLSLGAPSSCEGTGGTGGKCGYFGQASCDADTLCKWVTNFGCGVKAQCNDGIDNDGDTFIDYPKDTGCIDSFDDSESVSGSTPGSGCGSYISSPTCAAVSGCNWVTSSASSYGGYCEPTTTTSGCGTFVTQTTCTTNSQCRWNTLTSDGTSYCEPISSILAPTNLTASLSSDGKNVILGWGNSAGGVTEFKIWRKTASGWSFLTSVYKTTSQSVPPMTYTDSNVPSGSLEYQVQACTSASTCSYDSNRAYVTVSGTTATTGCSSLGTGWILSGNYCFNSSYTQYAPYSSTAAPTVASIQSCTGTNSPVTGCTSTGSTTGGTCSIAANCTTQANCTASNFFWYNNVCNSTAQTTTGTGAIQCSDGIDNDADGLIDYPADAGCYGPADTTESLDTTTAAGPASYTTDATCVGAGYFWCSNYSQCYSSASSCPSTTATCTSASAPGSCTDATSCGSAGFYWYNSACNSSPQTTTTSSCSSSSTCFDSTVCTSSGWYWYNGGCWSSPQPTTGGATTSGSPASYTSQSSCSEAGYYWCANNNQCYDSAGGCPASGASVFGLSKLFPRLFFR